MACSHWLSALLGPTPLAICITLVIALTIPLLLHFIVFRSDSATSLPLFLLIGPTNAGKTSILTQLERGQPAKTRTSQSPLVVEASLPVTTVVASSRYRSTNDPSLQTHKRFLLVDTPGHGKLRHHAMDSIVKPQHLRGIVYVVDAANISPGTAGLKEAADYLYDALILLQKSSTTNKLKQVPLLIAANKMDLFTALPAPLVKRVLENELTSVRSSRAKGLLDSGISMTDVDHGENKDWLGDGGEGNFQFSQLEEFNITVTVSGGSVASTSETDVKEWWEWIGNNL